VDHFAGGDLTSIIWERELFFIGDQPDEKATRPIDVTGRARCLISGHAASRILVGFGAAGLLKGGRRTGICRRNRRRNPSQPGQPSTGRPRGFEANLTISIEASMDHPVEVRLFNEQAGFDGRLALGQVALPRQLTSRPEKRSEFASAPGLLTDSAG
jgi:hypothetical protein